jgi:hypothetical protein
MRSMRPAGHGRVRVLPTTGDAVFERRIGTGQHRPGLRETGHIFGAPNEYASSGCDCGGQ